MQTRNVGKQIKRSQIAVTWKAAQIPDTRWVSASEPLRWTEWTDTGRTREHPVELIVEKEQQRTSHCGDTETRWVIA